jgi:GNAT superfamily N-acetyltransferase
VTLQGKRVQLRPLTRADLDEIEAWALHTDPLYAAWNRLPWHRLGKDLWHALQSADPALARYAIVDPLGAEGPAVEDLRVRPLGAEGPAVEDLRVRPLGAEGPAVEDLRVRPLGAEGPAVEDLRVRPPGRVIGLIGLVGVGRGCSPLLSIFLGSDFVGQGLGTDALRTLLRHAFGEWCFASVRLQVAATNARACRAYGKCGFRLTGRRYHPLEPEESLAFLDEPRYRHLQAHFRQEEGRTYLLFYDMEARAEEWQAWDQNLLQNSAD